MRARRRGVHRRGCRRRRKTGGHDRRRRAGRVTIRSTSASIAICSSSLERASRRTRSRRRCSSVVRRLDRDLPVTDIQSMDTRITGSLTARRSPAVLAAIFSSLAVLLTTIGTYGCSAMPCHSVVGRSACGWRSEQLRASALAVPDRRLAAACRRRGDRRRRRVGLRSRARESAFQRAGGRRGDTRWHAARQSRRTRGVPAAGAACGPDLADGGAGGGINSAAVLRCRTAAPLHCGTVSWRRRLAIVMIRPSGRSGRDLNNPQKLLRLKRAFLLQFLQSRGLRFTPWILRAAVERCQVDISRVVVRIEGQRFA